MFTDEQRVTFEETGILRLPNAFTRDEADAMAAAVWRFVERKSCVRRDDPTTWATPPISFKTLKRNPVFNPLVENDNVRAALDGIFGVGGWARPKPGAQVLLSFPTEPPWVLPNHLWHMDADFTRPTWPAFAVKLFACIAEVRPGGGATLALSGGHRLVEPFASTLDPDDRGGNQVTWRRYMQQDPWLGDIVREGPEPVRTHRLMNGPHEVAGVPIQIVEMAGEPGDVFVTHLQVFHCTAPNANDTPRLMLGKAILAGATGAQDAMREEDL